LGDTKKINWSPKNYLSQMGSFDAQDSKSVNSYIVDIMRHPSTQRGKKNKAERINLAYTAWQCANIAAHSNDHIHHVGAAFHYLSQPLFVEQFLSYQTVLNKAKNRQKIHS
jgi:hypothetical protein